MIVPGFNTAAAAGLADDTGDGGADCACTTTRADTNNAATRKNPIRAINLLPPGAGVTPAQGSVKPTVGFTTDSSRTRSEPHWSLSAALAVSNGRRQGLS